MSPEWVGEMVRPRSEAADSERYGLGFWLNASTDTAMLEGGDTGVSFHSAHNPRSGATRTVLSNTTEGAWPVARYLRERLEL